MLATSGKPGSKQDFGKVESGFPTKILRKQKTLSRDALAGQRISAQEERA
jgi:hypothetical protein